MNTATFLKIKTLVNQSQKVLITFNQDYSLDLVASALALSLLLEKSGKETTIACEGADFSAGYSFFPGIEKIKNNFSFLEKTLISIDISKTKVEEFSYTLEKDKLNIFITHEKGYFTPQEISNASITSFDLIFILGTPDLNLLGEGFKSHERIMEKTIINLDYHRENNQFGQITFIDQDSATSSEIIFKLISYFGKEYCLDEKIKTCLLNGIVGDHKNYFIPLREYFNVKLLGIALMKAKNNAEKNMAWTSLTLEDFNKAQAGENDLILLIKGLLNYYGQSKLLFLCYESADKIKAQIISPNKEINVLEKFKNFNPRGSNHFAEILIENKTLEETEKALIEEMKAGLLN